MIFLGEKVLSNKIKNPRKGDCPYTLFLGAGASNSSNIELTWELIDKWKSKIFEDLKKTNKRYSKISKDDWFEDKPFSDVIDGFYETYHMWKSENNKNEENTDYSLLFSSLYQTPRERQIFIEELIDGVKPTLGYMFLAGLIYADRFNRILTTNFDDLIGDALFKWYPKKPITCAFDSMVSGIRLDSKRPKIIKLHGDFLYDNLKNIRSELKSLDSNMEDKLFEMCKDRGLIVVGYSGSDKSIMNPLNEMLRKKGYLDMGLHWCFIKSDVQKIKNILKGKEKNDTVKNQFRELIELQRQYTDKVFFYEIGDFDSLMETMFDDCVCEPPPILTKPSNINPFQEFQESVMGAKTINELTETQQKYIKQFYEASKNKEGSKNLESFGEIYFKDGIIYRDKANESDKELNLNKALESFEKCKSPIYDYIKQFDDFDNIAIDDLKTVIYSLKRLSGVFIAIGKAKFNLNNNKEELIENLNQSLIYVEKGIALTNNLTTKHKSTNNKNLRSIPYNGCCALSLLSEQKGNIDENSKSKIIDYLKINISLNPNKSHAKEIMRVSDFAFALSKIGGEIKRKFKI